MEMIITLIIGAFIGVALTLVYAIYSGGKMVSSSDTARRDNNAAKLKLARKSLGQIANRESIGEVRKIAHHAIKHTI